MNRVLLLMLVGSNFALQVILGQPTFILEVTQVDLPRYTLKNHWSYCPGDMVKLDTLYTAFANVASTHWLKSTGDKVETLDDTTIALDGQSLIILEVTDLVGCYYLDTLNLSLKPECSPTFVLDESVEIPFRIFPNPAKRQICLNGTFEDIWFRFDIFNSIGQLVYVNKKFMVAGQNQICFNPDIMSGIYHVRVTTSGGTSSVFKIVFYSR